MNKTDKILIALSIFFAFIAGFSIYRSPVATLAAGLYRDTFDQITQATTTYSVGTGGTLVISDDNSNRVYFSLDNSGTVGVSCFPTTQATSSAGTYGGGWWLAANGGATSFDSSALYTGKVWCLTGSGTTTVGVVER